MALYVLLQALSAIKYRLLHYTASDSHIYLVTGLLSFL